MRRHLWWVLGLGLVVGGLVVALSARSAPTDFGWFAYAPLSEGPSWGDGWLTRVSRWQLVGCAVITLGLVMLAAGVGFRLGRRRSREAERS